MKRYFVIYSSLILLLFLLIFMNINSGSVDLSLAQVLDIILKNTEDSTKLTIVWELRLPRICAAVLLGGALTVAGFLLQTYFANPIAGPYILGISSGSKLTVALAMVFFLDRGRTLSSWEMVAAAFVGAMAAMGFVLLVSTKVRQMSILIVCGVMIGYICSAITEFVVTFAQDANIVNLHNWSLGSFSGMTWEKVRMMSVFVAYGVIASFCLSKPIGAFSLGENYARSVGVNVTLTRVFIIILSSLLAACVTAFAGPISFVGIAVPHIVRMLLKTSKPMVIIPGCFLAGAVVMLLCDGIARVLFAPTELSVSSVTAVLLVPVVIWMMIRRKDNGHA